MPTTNLNAYTFIFMKCILLFFIHIITLVFVIQLIFNIKIIVTYLNNIKTFFLLLVLGND